MSIPLKFTSLKLRNFLSFGNNLTQIDLSLDGSTLIQGENVDTGSANGAGKCVQANTLINIRNKRTGEIRSMTIADFYEEIRQSRRKG